MLFIDIPNAAQYILGCFAVFYFVKTHHVSLLIARILNISSITWKIVGKMFLCSCFVAEPIFHTMIAWIWNMDLCKDASIVLSVYCVTK
jgi:hypothetical protein